MDDRGKQRRLDDLLAQLESILCEIALLEPPDIVTLCLALPVDLAGYMSTLAQREDLDLPNVYTSFLLHGAWHSAVENGARAQAHAIARMIRRSADGRTWRTFAEGHPEVRDG